MSARDWSAELTAYIDGELSADEVVGVRAALEADPQLRALEAQLRRAVATVETLEAPVASAGLRWAVMHRLDVVGWRERFRAFLTPVRLIPVGALAAAAAVAVVWSTRHAVPNDEEQLFLAQNLEVLEDYELLGLESATDLEVVTQFAELEVR